MVRELNIVGLAVDIIAGLDKRRVDRAAGKLGVSSPTVYRWMRTGNLRRARGSDLLRVHNLTGIPLELLLGVGADTLQSRSNRAAKGARLRAHASGQNSDDSFEYE